MKLAIYGSSGHGRVLEDIAKLNGFTEVMFIDDGDNDYLSFEEFLSKNLKLPFSLGIGNNIIRQQIYNKLVSLNFEIVTLVHPSAIISPTSSIGIGTVIMPNVVVNANSKIGNGVILNTSCVIEHDSMIEDFVHISPSSSLAGSVTIGELTHIGIGSVIIQNINVGKNSVVGAGSVVLSNIDSNVMVYGIPAKKRIKL